MSVTAALVLVAVLVFLSGALGLMPVAALAGILTNAALGMVEVRSLRRQYRIDKVEFGLAMVTTLGVVLVGVLSGILIAVALAVVNLLRRISRPHDAVLGRVPEEEGLVSVGRHPDAEPMPGVIIYRFDAPLYFFNADHFRHRVTELVGEAGGGIRWFVLNAEAISDIDLTAAHVLSDVGAWLRVRGIRPVIARAHGRLRAHLERTGLTAEIGERHMFPSVREAVDFIGRAEAPE
jgi:MFS superfamily sulfate permease-like transporter